MTKFIMLIRKADRQIRKRLTERHIRRVGCIANARLKNAVLRRTIPGTALNNRIIDYTKCGVISAEVDKTTGEVVFVFNDNSVANEFMNGFKVA